MYTKCIFRFESFQTIYLIENEPYNLHRPSLHHLKQKKKKYRVRAPNKKVEKRKTERLKESEKSAGQRSNIHCLRKNTFCKKTKKLERVKKKKLRFWSVARQCG